MKKIIVIFFVSLFAFSCKKDKATDPIFDPGNEEFLLDVPIGFPYPNIPSDNKPTLNRIALGEKLFFDPILSRDSTISCGTCHLPGLKFTDGVPLSLGISGRHAMRNSMTILNVAYQPYSFWDGGVPNLEQQVLAPIENPNEMDFDDYSFQNNGLYSVYPDSGRARITGNQSDIGKFKVPSLRNVELTAPYMHDGSIATLEEVVDHYNSGGQPHPNKSNVVRPKNLTPQQKQDVVNFLKALTDQ